MSAVLFLISVGILIIYFNIKYTSTLKKNCSLETSLLIIYKVSDYNSYNTSVLACMSSRGEKILTIVDLFETLYFSIYFLSHSRYL